jgi:hypothetical protein
MTTWVGRILSVSIVGAFVIGAGAGCSGDREIPLSVEQAKKLPPPPKPLDDKSAQNIPPQFQNVVKNASGNSTKPVGR